MYNEEGKCWLQIVCIKELSMNDDIVKGRILAWIEGRCTIPYILFPMFMILVKTNKQKNPNPPTII